MSFKDYQLQPYLSKALENMGFEEPTEIQAKVIPLLEQGENIVAQSQTGSGKTLAFLLPLMSKLDLAKEQIQLIVLAPSRELAEQLYKVAQGLAEYSDQTIAIQRVVGGTDSQRLENNLKQKQPHIIIGTPGRVLDMLKKNLLDVRETKMLVIDEADMMLDMGFINDTDAIASQFGKDLQIAVFSATIPEKLQPFLKKYLENPKQVVIKPQSVIAPTIENLLMPVRGRDPFQLLYKTLTVGQPYLVLIFANTTDKVDEIHGYLTNKGLKVGKIHGDITSRERRRVMKQIQNMDYQYVVASDLAARGIDIEGVSHVINFEVPNELEFFIHRVGRTGRQGMDGIAITFYEPDNEEDIVWLEQRQIRFQPVDLVNGDFVELPSRHRRSERRNTAQTEDQKHQIKGMVNRAKKGKVKPGYKKKLNRQIRDTQKRNNRVRRKGK